MQCMPGSGLWVHAPAACLRTTKPVKGRGMSWPMDTWRVPVSLCPASARRAACVSWSWGSGARVGDVEGGRLTLTLTLAPVLTLLLRVLRWWRVAAVLGRVRHGIEPHAAEEEPRRAGADQVHGAHAAHAACMHTHACAGVLACAAPPSKVHGRSVSGTEVVLGALAVAMTAPWTTRMAPCGVMWPWPVAAMAPMLVVPHACTCRGKAGRVQGNLMGVMCVIKGTPTTYNKDFQVRAQRGAGAAVCGARVMIAS